jgi:hypothetical protein
MSFWSWRDFSDRAACGHSGARYTVLLDSLADGVMGGRPCTISGGGGGGGAWEWPADVGERWKDVRRYHRVVCVFETSMLRCGSCCGLGAGRIYLRTAHNHNLCLGAAPAGTTASTTTSGAL